MNILEDWPAIRAHFNKSIRSNFHVSIGSVDKDGNTVVDCA